MVLNCSPPLLASPVVNKYEGKCTFVKIIGKKMAIVMDYIINVLSLERLYFVVGVGTVIVIGIWIFRPRTPDLEKPAVSGSKVKAEQREPGGRILAT